MKGVAWIDRRGGAARARCPTNRAHGLLVLGVLVVALVGCTPHRRRNGNYCEPDPDAGFVCKPPQTCDVKTYTCVSDAGFGPGGGAGGNGGAAAGGGGGAPIADGGLGADADAGADAGADRDAEGGTGGAAGAGGGGGGGDRGDGSASNRSDAPRTCGACVADVPVCDTNTGKCGPCSKPEDCQSFKGAPFCASGKCVACRMKADCVDATLPICNAAGACVECVGDGDCPLTTKSFCSSAASACVSCTTAPSGACAAKSAALPVCASTGACVECGVDTDCHQPTTPFCSPAGTCVPCAKAPAGTTCAQKTVAPGAAAKPVCGSSGACVECGVASDCHEPAKPSCSTQGTCVPCGMAPPGSGGCAARTPSQPVCAPSGACVQCLANTDCAGTTPVCSTTNTCGKCVADTDCAGRAGPTVCMSHQDGRCATDAETIYVQNGAGCSDTTGTTGGTSARPFCSLLPAVAIVGTARNLIVVRGSVMGATAVFQSPTRQLSIVGQIPTAGQTLALISGGLNPALHFGAANAYVRNLRLSASSIGCQADAGSTIRLDHVVVNGNSGGGILLDGAAFVIANTTITNNGPGDVMGVALGGIRAQNIPMAGPAQLQNVTVQDNLAPGVSCSAKVQGTEVLATGNPVMDVSPTCGFQPCTTAGPTCGALP